MSALAGALAALPALLLVLTLGPLPAPDTGTYLAYAAELRLGLPYGAELLRLGPAPASLFRAPGYPLLLAALGPWPATLLAIALFGAVCAGVAAFGRRIGLPAWLACAVGALPGLSMATPFIASLLPDGMALALTAGAWLVLAGAALGAGPGLGAAGLAGGLLAAATLFREATPYVALFALPLALLTPGAWPARLARAALVAGLPFAAMAGLMAWNAARVGAAVSTTSRQVVMVQALLPLLRAGVNLYPGEDGYDRIARESLGAGEYGGIVRMNDRLFHEAGMTAPQMAAEASRRYGAAWADHPVAMLRATAGRIDASLIGAPFDPASAASVIAIHLGWARPVFDRLTPLLREARQGDIASAATVAAVVVPRLIGLALGIGALVGPPLLWLRRRCQQSRLLLALWFAGFGIVAVYLPIHIEPRYLAPLLALVPLLAASLWLRRPTGSGCSATVTAAATAGSSASASSRRPSCG